MFSRGRSTSWVTAALVSMLGACASTEPSQPATPFFSYSAVEWAPGVGLARVELRNRSRVRLAVEGCPSLEVRTGAGGWAEVPRSEQQSCVWPIFLVQPDSSVAFDFPVSALAAECGYRLGVRVAIPEEQGSEKVYTGDLAFEQVVSPDLCVQ